MLKDLLKSLYKAKPELIEEHKRLVDVLRSGSKKEQVAEAERQLKELKEMVEKGDRCWEGYEPTPGKKPYEKGSCRPVEKQDVVTFDKEDKRQRSWKIKIKKQPGYHEVKDVLDMGSQQHNSYVLHDGRTIGHDQVEDLDITGKNGDGLEKSNYGPKGMNLYNAVDNIKRKSTRTGEVREGVGQNQAVREYTSTPHGTATQQAARQAAKDKKKSAANPVRSMKDMSEEEINAIKAKYAAKSDQTDKVSSIKAKSALPKEKSLSDKIRDVKAKYAEPAAIPDQQRVENIKQKYSHYLSKSSGDLDIQHLIKEVSTRQPTDKEIELILEYNNKITQEMQQTPAGTIDPEEQG